MSKELILRPTAGWRALDTREVWRFRDLLRALAIRDVKLRYRQTALGAIWVVLQPLLAAGIFSFVFGAVAQLPSDGVPYVVFAYAGLLGWNAFNSTATKSSMSLVQHAPMVQKIYFPRLVLPLSVLPGAVLDFVVALVVMVVLMLTTGAVAGPAIVLLPVWLVLALMLGLAIGLIAGALMVHYRDVGQILPVFMQMLLYVSPVAYSLDAIPEKWLFLFSLNPMVGVLEGFRWSLLPSTDLDVALSVYSALVSIVLLVVGAYMFARMERRFADVI